MSGSNHITVTAEGTSLLPYFMGENTTRTINCLIDSMMFLLVHFNKIIPTFIISWGRT
jgi:hypothetical protein